MQIEQDNRSKPEPDPVTLCKYKNLIIIGCKKCTGINIFNKTFNFFCNYEITIKRDNSSRYYATS